ncbi:hypothetical protein QYF36_019513 [Acer negundo]|nr:hypothetical protein QYF36_019513 [Acer negundo]
MESDSVDSMVHRTQEGTIYHTHEATTHHAQEVLSSVSLASIDLTSIAKALNFQSSVSSKSLPVSTLHFISPICNTRKSACLTLNDHHVISPLNTSHNSTDHSQDTTPVDYLNEPRQSPLHTQDTAVVPFQPIQSMAATQDTDVVQTQDTTVVSVLPIQSVAATHPMVTRSKLGIYKPKTYSAM